MDGLPKRGVRHTWIVPNFDLWMWQPVPTVFPEPLMGLTCAEKLRRHLAGVPNRGRGRDGLGRVKTQGHGDSGYPGLIERSLQLWRIALQQRQSLRPFGFDPDLHRGIGRAVDLDLEMPKPIGL